MPADQTTFFHPALGFLLVAVVLPFLARGQAWRWLTLAAPLAALASLAGLALSMGDAPLELGRVQWLGMTLVLGHVDKLAMVFAAIFSLQALIAAVYALDVKSPGEPAAAALHVGGCLGCLFAGDYVTLFVFWEMASLGSTLLIWLRRTDRAIAAGYRYFLFHILGGVLLLLGLVLRAKATGSLAFGPMDVSALAFYDWLILGGFAVNAAVVPLHAWLSDAYPEASAMGGVYLCAFTTKTSVYVLARAFAGLDLLVPLGALMTLYAGVYALVQNDARRALAYQTIAQVGFMVAGVGVGTQMAINGACAHAVAHVAYKGLMFMAVGAVMTGAGTVALTRLGGLWKRMPLVAACYLAAAASTAGLPLFGGFTTKSMTIAAVSGYGHWAGLALELGALAAILGVGVRLPHLLFFSSARGDAAGEGPIPVSANARWAMLAAALVCLGVGVVPGAVYALLPYPVDFTPYSVWSVLQSLMLVGFGVLAYVLARGLLAPTPGRILDLDALYAALGRVFLALVSRPVAAVDAWFSEVYRTVGLRGLMLKARWAAVFDRQGIDTMVDGAAYATAHLGRVATLIQTGRLREYLTASVIVAVAAFVAVWFF